MSIDGRPLIKLGALFLFRSQINIPNADRSLMHEVPLCISLCDTLDVLVIRVAHWYYQLAAYLELVDQGFGDLLGAGAYVDGVVRGFWGVAQAAVAADDFDLAACKFLGV